MADEDDTASRQVYDLEPVPVLQEDKVHTFSLVTEGIPVEKLQGTNFCWRFSTTFQDDTYWQETSKGFGLTSITRSFSSSETYVLDLYDCSDPADLYSAVTFTVRNVIPVPGITIERASTFEDETITFTTEGTWDTPSDLPTLRFSWKFDDGTSTAFGDGTSVQQTYSDPGVHSVTLRAEDDDSDIGTVVMQFRVDNQPPLAIAGKDIVASEDQAIHFSGLRSLDTVSDMGSLTFEWDLGDGTTFTGPEVEHSYAQSGAYTAWLTVTDDDGASTKDPVVIAVNNEPPEARANIIQEAGGSFVILDGSMTTDSKADMPLLRYIWTLEDGSTIFSKVKGHRFTEPGSYTVTLKVFDPEGGSDEDTIAITVINMAPRITLKMDKEVFEDRVVTMDASGSSDTDGEVRDFEWEFGDGTTGDGQVVDHSYSKKGTYMVKLTVVDDLGSKTIVERDIEVLNKVPVPHVTGDVIGNVGQEMLFDASGTSDTPSDKPLLEFTWDFGDGTIGHGSVISHAFQEAGDHDVTVTVRDDDGAMAEATYKVTVLLKEVMDLLGERVLKIDLEIHDELTGGPGIEPEEMFLVQGRVYLVTEHDIPGAFGGDQQAEVVLFIPQTGARLTKEADIGGDFEFNVLAPKDPGKFDLLITATLRPLTTQVATDLLVEGEEETSPIVIDPMIAGITTVSISTIAIGAVGGTDLGRYKFFTLLIPLFTRIRKAKVLDHFERGRIYEHIRKNPGDSYSSIRKNLDLKNGALAHHLSVLERHEYIVSRRDGMYKRFYPKGMKIPEGTHKSIQENILELIMSDPRITQKDMAERLSIDRSTVNYHVKVLLALGVIRSEKEGRVKFYYFVGVKDPVPYSG